MEEQKVEKHSLQPQFLSNTNDEIEIDLLEIAQLLLRKIHYIIITTIVCGAVALLITLFFITPQYKASSMIYIFTQTTSITSLADLQMGQQLALDFEILATSHPVLDAVIQELSLDATAEQLLNTVQVYNESGTRILELIVENPDPQLAADISNAWSIALSERVADIMNTDAPAIAVTAIAPKNPDSPNTLTNTAIGALLGLLISAGLIVTLHLVDDTIKTKEDIEKYLHITVLAAIPSESSADSTNSSKSKTSKKHFNSRKSSNFFH